MAYVKPYTDRHGVQRYSAMYKDPKGEWVTKVVTKGDGSAEKTKELVHRHKSAGSFDTKDRAMEIATAMEEEKGSLLGTDPAFRATVTIEEFVELFLTNHRMEPNTRQLYRNVLLAQVVPRIGTFRVAEIRRENIRRLLLALEQDGTKSSVLKVARSAISSMMKLAWDDGYRTDNPAEKLVTPSFSHRPQRAWAMDQFNQFAVHLPNRPAKTYATFQVLTGARYGEMAALRVGDVDFVRRKLAICKVVIKLAEKVPEFPFRLVERNRTKTSQDRTIDLGRDVLDMVSRYTAEFGLGPEDLLFPAALVTPKPVPPTLEELMAGCLELPTPRSRGGRKTYEHGTVNAYISGGCQGPWCTKAATDYASERRRIREGRPEPVPAAEKPAAPYLDPDAWGEVFEAAATAAGLPLIKQKALRHSHAIALLDAGVPGIRIAQRMGHSREVLMGHYIVEREGIPDIDHEVLDGLGVQLPV